MAVPVAHLLRCARLLFDDMPGLPFFRQPTELINISQLYGPPAPPHDITLPTRIWY
jgi:hypothetical protein